MENMNGLNLNTSQRDALDELRKRISDDLKCNLHDDTYTYYRFLKARDFNVDQAEIMLRNSLEWRKRNQMDAIRDYTPPEVLKNHLDNLHVGYDKEGCPVFFTPLGKLDYKGMFMSVKVEEISKTFLQICDRCEWLTEIQSQKYNKRIYGYVHIIDVGGYSFANATDKRVLDLQIWLSKLTQDNYPERIKAVFIINSTTYFTFAFAIIKTFLSSELMSKFHIFSDVGWKEELLKVIDADELPAFLGGNRTDPDGDPLCKTIVCQAGKIDEKYFIHKSKKSLAMCPGVEKLVLSRASFSEVILEVEEPGSLIQWEFETKARDIAFGVFYKEGSGDEEINTELVSLQRLETVDYAEKGLYKCERPGTYVILFDNSYSMMRSKEIYYILSVVSPTEHEESIEKYSG